MLGDHCSFLRTWRAPTHGGAILRRGFDVTRSRGPRAKDGMRQIEELAARIAASTTGDGVVETPIPGLYLSRHSTTASPRHTVDRAVFCVVAQGAKSILLNDRRYVYDASKYLVVSLDLPLVGQVVEASPERPFLGLSITLDFAELGALCLDAGLPVRSDTGPGGLTIRPMPNDLVDGLVRLVGLLATPAQIPVMAPLIRREILYKLLLSDEGGVLRQIAARGGQVRRIAAGLEWLRQNAARPIRMQDLAREVHMSPSTMHAWFKAVTAMSPLQFQKQLRLQEARRILLAEDADAKTASQRVGYESPSQFSREYRRLFGASPLRDVARLRAAGAAP